jgi:hypothetical protein
VPELGWRDGYPVVVAITAMVRIPLHRNVERRGWL